MGVQVGSVRQLLPYGTESFVPGDLIYREIPAIAFLQKKRVISIVGDEISRDLRSFFDVTNATS